MKKKGLLLYFLIFLVIPVLAFTAGYVWTDAVFRAQKFPFPFERFGITAGAGLVLWSLAFAFLVKGQIDKRRIP